MRSRSLLAARSRHPTQVRSGQARACVRPDIIKSTSPRRPHPFGAMVEHSLAKNTRFISARSAVPRRRTSRARVRLGGVGRRPVDRGPRWPTGAVRWLDTVRPALDVQRTQVRDRQRSGGPRCGRRTADGGRRGAYGRYGQYGRTGRTAYERPSPRRTVRTPAPSRPVPPRTRPRRTLARPNSRFPRCARAPQRQPRQPRSPRGDRPAAAPASSAPSVCSVSGRMSMRQPVRRAARRAFCPSLPIASDSW